MVDEGPERTIIFNPRVCNDIDLDIGKWIRIHPPWYDSCVFCITALSDQKYHPESPTVYLVWLMLSFVSHYCIISTNKLSEVCWINSVQEGDPCRHCSKHNPVDIFL